MNNEIIEAVKIIKQGGIVIFPTDTVYGIGCAVSNKLAVKRLFKVRNRPEEKATPVLIESLSQTKDYFQEVPSEVKKLMDKYWPGALTIIYLCQKEKIPSLVRGGGNTIGLRMPDSEIARSIIKGVGEAILGPSANFHQAATPKSFSELDPQLIGKVDFVVKGETKLKTASTVLDCTKVPFRVIRQGGLILNEKDLIH